MVLVGYWPLNEDSGSTAYDYSGNGNDGTVNGPSTGITGVAGATAYDFEEGNSDDVTVGDIDILTAGTMGGFAVSVWVNVESTDSADVVLGKNNEYRIVNNSGTWRFSVYDSGNSTWRNLDGSSVSTSTWTHLAVFWDGTNQKLYVDGLEDASATPTVTLNSTTNGLTIGDNSAQGNHFDGKIQEVRIYNHALTLAEIQYLYTVGKRGAFVSGKKTV